MTIRNIIITSLFVVTYLASTASQAEVISQYTSFERFERTCPGLQDSAYMEKYAAGIAAVRNKPISALNTEDACIFNSAFQARFYNLDGTPIFDGYPIVAPFNLDDLGTAGWTEQVFGEESVLVEASDGSYYGAVSLDPDNLALPEFKIQSDSEALQRNSINGVAISEYLWTGEDTTLNFVSNFDFMSSFGAWNIPGATFNDFLVNYQIGMSSSVEVESGFNIRFSDDTVSSSWLSTADLFTIPGPNEIFADELSIAFDVSKGQRFSLWGFIQAFGLNGGYVDGRNTFTTALLVDGLDEQESLQVFQAALVIAPAAVSAPSVGALFSLALLIFLRRKA